MAQQGEEVLASIEAASSSGKTLKQGRGSRGVARPNVTTRNRAKTPTMLPPAVPSSTSTSRTWKDRPLPIAGGLRQHGQMEKIITPSQEEPLEDAPTEDTLLHLEVESMSARSSNLEAKLNQLESVSSSHQEALENLREGQKALLEQVTSIQRMMSEIRAEIKQGAEKDNSSKEGRRPGQSSRTLATPVDTTHPGPDHLVAPKAPSVPDAGSGSSSRVAEGPAWKRSKLM